MTSALCASRCVSVSMQVHGARTLCVQRHRRLHQHLRQVTQTHQRKYICIPWKRSFSSWSSGAGTREHWPLCRADFCWLVLFCKKAEHHGMGSRKFWSWECLAQVTWSPRGVNLCGLLSDLWQNSLLSVKASVWVISMIPSSGKASHVKKIETCSVLKEISLCRNTASDHMGAASHKRA